jgi:hypothetical protein
MRYALALILACCALLAFSGCAKITGERIEFGHTYPCHSLRNKVYHVTYSEDASRINLYIKNAQGGCKNSYSYTSPCDSDCLKPNNRCCEAHAQIMRALNNYREGFLGWF